MSVCWCSEPTVWNRPVFGRDRRASVVSRSEEDNRIARKNRKEWSVSKSQVLLERQAAGDEVGAGSVGWSRDASADGSLVCSSETSGETSQTKESAAGRQTSHSVAVPGRLLPAQPVQPSEPPARLAAHSQKLQYVPPGPRPPIRTPRVNLPSLCLCHTHTHTLLQVTLRYSATVTPAWPTPRGRRRRCLQRNTPMIPTTPGSPQRYRLAPPTGSRAADYTSDASSVSQHTPPLPVKHDGKPPPPPPKTRKSMFPA